MEILVGIIVITFAIFRFKAFLLLPVFVWIILNNETYSKFVDFSFASARRVSNLPQSANPRYETTEEIEDEQEKEETNELPKNLPNAKINAFEYTNSGIQQKRDEYIFRKQPIVQTSESRAKMLDKMYEELLENSVFGDPFLHNVKCKDKSEK